MPSFLNKCFDQIPLYSQFKYELISLHDVLVCHMSDCEFGYLKLINNGSHYLLLLWLMISWSCPMNLAVFMTFDCLKCFITNNITLPEVPISFLNLKTKDRVTFKKLAISKSLCRLHSAPFYFFYLIGSIHINVVDLSEREISMLEFGTCLVILC